MSARAGRSRAKLPDRQRRRVLSRALRPGPGQPVAPELVAELLGRWQARELRIARSFAESGGLTREELKDVYQETVLALLDRHYASEEHLRNTLRAAIKRRALNLHRDESRRGEILEDSVHQMPSAAASGEHDGPEQAVLVHEDRLIVAEFLTELTALEQRVFWLIAEGMKYRAISAELGIERNQTRNAARSCERKRQQFQLLYDTGRLCGFRAMTIQALQNGENTSNELALRAFAHLEACAHCRAEHHTNARRLRRRFEGQVAGFLPLPALPARIKWSGRTGLSARLSLTRTISERLRSAPNGAGERTSVLLTGGELGVKVAAGAATVAVLAGATVGATHILGRPPATRHHLASYAPGGGVPDGTFQSSLPGLAEARAHRQSDSRSGSGHVAHAAPQAHRSHRLRTQHEPDGFAYLGVPEQRTAPASAPEPVRTTASRTGGPFSP